MNKLLSKTIKLLKTDDRVMIIFSTGSFINKTNNNLSDIDLWIVAKEESQLISFLQDIKKIFSNIDKVISIYFTTPTHVFIIFENGIQIDLNIISAALYFTLRKNKTILLDKYLLTLEKNEKVIVEHKDEIRSLLIIGYTSLERAMSKYLKKDYYLVARFLDNVRNSSIIPLLPFVEEMQFDNYANIKFDKMHDNIRNDFINCFCVPNKKGVELALKSTLNLLDFISIKTKNSIHKKYSRKIIKYLN